MNDAARIERFLSRAFPEPNSGCWLWTGPMRPRGYGASNICPGEQLAHRAAYRLLVGPIPDGLTIDHLCRNRACVNPVHLEPVVNRENVLRGYGPTAENARKDACIRGHAYTPENTIERVRDGYPTRECRACNRVKQRAYKAKVRTKHVEILRKEAA